MSARYAPLPNPHTDPTAENEMEAAFDDSDDEEDTLGIHAPNRNGYHSLPRDDPFTPDAETPATTRPTPNTGTYDFENVDYDYIRPPPGSPPGPSSRALPNEFGNTNGEVPSFQQVPTDSERYRRGWFSRAATSVLPSHYVQRLGLAPQIPSGAVGGGTSNDGVFANVTAKPSRPVRIQEGDESYLVPEETQKEAPPSYASAQADSVPPYWETTIHAPSSSNTPGDMIIDGLATGSLFSFLWNMLVSISFQFVGFLLTYLLHTTHAAKLGSRAGLGVTLIQYGFAMRGRADDLGDQAGWGSGKTSAPPAPTFGTFAEAAEYYNHHNTSSMGMGMGSEMGMGAISQATTTSAPDPNVMLGDVTTEWLSFFLMTVGWFILLTSLLGFWRVKRWERSILSTQQQDHPISSTSPVEEARILENLRNVFGGVVTSSTTPRSSGFGFPGARGGRSRFIHADLRESLEGEGGRERDGDGEDEREREVDGDEDEDVITPMRDGQGQYIIPIDPNDEEQTGRIVRALADEARLQRDLRAAGLL